MPSTFPTRWSRQRARTIVAVLSLTALVVAVTSLVHHAHLRRAVVEQTASEGELIARQAYAAIARSLAAAAGRDPVRALQGDAELRALIESGATYAPHVIYVAVIGPDGRAILHSQTGREGQDVPSHESFDAYRARNPVRRLIDGYRGEQIYDLSLPFDLDGRPFGAVRVGIAMPLVRAELRAALATSLVLGGLSLLAALAVAIWLSARVTRPLRELGHALERLRRGEYTGQSEPRVRRAVPRDEFGRLGQQLQLLGEQIQSDRVQLATERAQFQSTVDQIEDGIVFVNGERRIVFANQAIAPVLGKPAADLGGALIEDVMSADHPLRALLSQALDAGKGARNVVVRPPTGPSGHQFTVSTFPLEDGQGGCSGAIAVTKDVRAVAVSMQTLQSLVRYAAQLTALGRATSVVAHEVKNPLNAMTLHLELARAKLEQNPGEVRASLDKISAGIGVVDGIVQRFLERVRPPDLTLSSVSVNELIQDVAGLVEAERGTRGMTVICRLDPALPPVVGDGELLRQCLVNLVVNACEAMPTSGEIHISTARESDNHVRIVVRDNGTGIPPEDLQHVFTLYYTTKSGGSGIGLALVQRVAELHQGTVEIQSEVGRGTTVVLRLPVE